MSRQQKVFEECCCSSVSVCFPLFGAETLLPLLVEVPQVENKSRKHEHKIGVQEVREVERGADRFWQRDAEEFGLLEDGNGFYHSNDFS